MDCKVAVLVGNACACDDVDSSSHGKGYLDVLRWLMSSNVIKDNTTSKAAFPVDSKNCARWKFLQ